MWGLSENRVPLNPLVNHMLIIIFPIQWQFYRYTAVYPLFRQTHVGLGKISTNPPNDQVDPVNQCQLAALAILQDSNPLFGSELRGWF